MTKQILQMKMLMMIKYVLVLAVGLGLLITPLSSAASEVTEYRSYEYCLTVNDEATVYAEAGDLLTVVLTLKRTDSEEAFSVRAMQDEIRYHPDFFEIVEDSIFTADGVETTDIALTDGERAFYINFLSLGTEVEWKNETRVATFQVKVLGEKGSSYFINENCKVSLSDGSGSYDTTTEDLLVIVTDDGLVGSIPEKFVTTSDEVSEVVSEENKTVPAEVAIGGLYVGVFGFLIFFFKKPSVTILLDESKELTKFAVRRGRYVKKPSDPVEDGKIFEGWYADKEFTKPWNFETDKVIKSMKLYAKWTEAEVPEKVQEIVQEAQGITEEVTETTEEIIKEEIEKKS